VAFSSIPVEVLLAVAAGLLLVLLCVATAALVLQNRSRRRLTELAARLGELDRTSERSERAVREELSKSREETSGAGKLLREEVAASVQGFGESFGKGLTDLRGVIDGHLDKLREENSRKLDEMRSTVDEKLQGTLEKRLNHAFHQVSERLEAVHQGLGEMQSLANGVGDLKKVLTNVKTRGTWGEVQLGEILDQILAPDQFERNVAVRRGSAERVDFAVKLPGRSEDGGDVVWLPIDAKFPQEDYQRLLDAQERGDAAAVEKAARELETRVKQEARSVRDKYLKPPSTTDFGIMFLPTEGLYAEVQRRSGLADHLREQRVVIAGPANLAALLSALKMGFRTLAVQKRSSEVWKLLGAVKTQFGQFHGLLEKVHDKLQQASNTIEDASRKTRNIEKRLGKVEELPAGEADELFPNLATGEPDD
jgi:DNA recombination protein RmuC